MSNGVIDRERSGERYRAPRLQVRSLRYTSFHLIPACASSRNGTGSNASGDAVWPVGQPRKDHSGNGRNGGQAMSRSYTVSAIGPNGLFKVKGQTARALMALVGAVDKGVTSLEVSCWAYRFAAYCHDLRHKHGLVIDTIRESHAGGWHGRHVLRSPVQIVGGGDE